MRSSKKNLLHRQQEKCWNSLREKYWESEDGTWTIVRALKGIHVEKCHRVGMEIQQKKGRTGQQRIRQKYKKTKLWVVLWFILPAKRGAEILHFCGHSTGNVCRRCAFDVADGSLLRSGPSGFVSRWLDAYTSINCIHQISSSDLRSELLITIHALYWYCFWLCITCSRVCSFERTGFHCSLIFRLHWKYSFVIFFSYYTLEK